MEQAEKQSIEGKNPLDIDQVERVLAFFHKIALMRKHANEIEINNIEKLQIEFCSNDNK